MLEQWQEAIDWGILSIGKEWDKSGCQCDPSVGMAPCHYCAEHGAILAGEQMLREINRLNDEIYDLSLGNLELHSKLSKCYKLLQEACDNWTDACVIASEDGKCSVEYGVSIVNMKWKDQAIEILGQAND